MDTKIESTRAIAVPAAGRLSIPIALIKRHSKLLAALALLIIGGALAFVWWSRRDTSGEYVTDKVTRGTIEVNVSATGTVQAVTTVQVGSQVSGSVSWLGADFKSSVKRGQVIAKLDPALFQAQVDTGRANLMNAQAGVQAAMTDIQNQQANIEAAKANDLANKAARDDAIAIAKQNEKLKGIIPDRDIESSENAAKAAAARYSQATSQIGQAQAQFQIAQAKLKQAQAAVGQANAQLEQAQVNLEHSIITSPIDGVVVSRSVDVGQTVAASLQAPTLFTIANDLTNMQVLASIDEADVGQIREGGKAHFTVDAFPGQTFYGDITQVRLNAQTLQNVVTYTAVIAVSNPDQKLMPGMTANITVPVARRDDVLRIPNAALRFKPDLTEQQQKDLQAKIDAFRQQQQNENNSQGDQQASGQAQGQASASAKEPADQNRSQPPGENSAQPQSPRHQRGDAGPGTGTGQPPRAQAAKGGPGGLRRHEISAPEGDAAGPPADNQNPNADNAGPNGPRKRHQAGDQNASLAPRHQGGAQGQPPNGGGERPHGPDQNARSGKQQGKPAAQPQSAPDNQNAAAGSSRRAGGGGQRGYQVIWIMTANKTLEPHVVRTGITDGRFTEIVKADFDLKEGDVSTLR